MYVWVDEKGAQMNKRQPMFCIVYSKVFFGYIKCVYDKLWMLMLRTCFYCSQNGSWVQQRARKNEYKKKITRIERITGAENIQNKKNRETK